MRNNFKHSSKIKYPTSEEIRRQVEKLAADRKQEIEKKEYGITYDSQMSDNLFFTKSKPESPESIESFRLIWNSISKETKAKLFDTNQEPSKLDTATLGAAAQQVAVQHQEPDKDSLETLGVAHQADID